MKYLQIILMLSVVFVFIACDSLTTTIDTEDDEFFARQMVVGSIIDVNSPFVSFLVGENRGFLENGSFEDFNLSNAMMTITKEATGDIIDSENADEAPDSPEENYFFPLIDSSFFEAGDYTFLVEHPSYPVSETTLTIPEAGQIEDIEFQYEDGIDINGNETSSLTFDIIDAPGPNFYELQVFVDDRAISVETFDPSGSTGLSFRNLLFRDDSFDGQIKRIEIKFDRFFWNPDSSEEIRINWISVNEGYFLLSKSVQRQSETQDNPFSSAVQINGNLNDALGVIGFRNISEFVITP